MTRTLPLAFALLYCAGAAAADLDVSLTDIRVPKGTLMVAVVDAAGWDGTAKAVASVRLAATDNMQPVHFSDLAPGRYAVQAIHDENDNGQLDTNFMGMPTEGYGFSNNPQVLRKPTFDEAAFELGSAGQTLTIQLR